MIDELRNRRVGLIGANGFVGSAILQALLRTGVTPRVLCGPDSAPRPIPDGIDSLTCDLTDAEALKSWVSELDVIIHAAGPPSVKQSFEMPKEYVRVHVQGTAAVAHACHEAGVDRLVYISSAEVYGRPNVKAVSESHRLQARSPYAAAKIGAEKIIEAYAESFGLKAVFCVRSRFMVRIRRPSLYWAPSLRRPMPVASVCGTSDQFVITVTSETWPRPQCRPVVS